MIAYRVLVVTNLWPYAKDPSYGCFVQAQMESLRPLGVDFDLLFVNGRESRWNYLHGVYALRRRLRGGRYDLIHAHMGLSGWVARCQLRIPLVVSFMGNDVPGKVDRRGRTTLLGCLFEVSSLILARLADAVIVKSLPMKRRLRLDSAHVIPNGVDTILFRPGDRAETRRVLGLDPGKQYVLFPYSPAVPGKRYDLVEAAVLLARECIPELEILPIMQAPQSCMPLYMNAADVMVIASMQEGSPNSVKEALAVNLPVVSVDVGDVADLLRPTEGNYIVERKPEIIAEKIVEVCRRGQRSHSRNRIVEHLSLEQVAKRIVQVYASVIKPNPLSPPQLSTADREQQVQLK